MLYSDDPSVLKRTRNLASCECGLDVNATIVVSNVGLNPDGIVSEKDTHAEEDTSRLKRVSPDLVPALQMTILPIRIQHIVLPYPYGISLYTEFVLVSVIVAKSIVCVWIDKIVIVCYTRYEV